MGATSINSTLTGAIDYLNVINSVYTSEIKLGLASLVFIVSLILFQHLQTFTHPYLKLCKNAESPLQHMNDFIAFNTHDYNCAIEFFFANTNTLNPIILIPGVAGSQIEAVSKQTGEVDLAWINPNLTKAIDKCCQYMWGETNEKTGVFDSYLGKYANIRAVDGIEGCNHLLSSDILENVQQYPSLGNYFGKYIEYLENTYGYVKNYNLFAYSYDWRQSVSVDFVQDNLDKLIKNVVAQTGKKVTLIGHSLGGVLAQIYCRLHPYFDTYVKQFVAVACPFDGSSGYLFQAPLFGYNLRLRVLPHCLAKGMQASCGCTTFLGPNLHGQFNGQTQIFIKKAKNFQEPSKYSRYYDYKSQKYDQIHLDISIYNDVPDLSFVLAQEIVERRLLRHDQIEEVFKNLVQCSKAGSIKCDFLKQSPISPRLVPILTQKSIASIVEKEFFEPQPRSDFDWSCFTMWTERPYEYTPNVFFAEKDGNLLFFDEFMHYLSDEAAIIGSSHQTDYFRAKHYYQEHQDKRGPWASKQQRDQIKTDSLLNLTRFVHEPGTFDSVVYRPGSKTYEDTKEAKGKPIVLTKDSEFRFVSISGCGSETPIHAVYETVEKYPELLTQKPSFVMGDGDGTVLTTAALGDDFVGGHRIVIPGLQHFCLADQRFWTAVDQFLK